jgi:hypothetical protein
MTSRTPIHASLLRLPTSLLYGAGARDHVIAAGVLHDVLEKTDADAEDLRSRFGTRVATLVLAVSEDQHIRGYAKRKAALRKQVAAAGREALMVFAADKVSKVHELNLEYERPCEQSARGPSRRDRRIDHFRHCLDLLEELLGDSPLVIDLRGELDHARRRRAAWRSHRPALGPETVAT